MAWKENQTWMTDSVFEKRSYWLLNPSFRSLSILTKFPLQKCSWDHNTRMHTSCILTITSMFILSPLISLCPLLPSPQSLLLWFPCKTLGTWPGHLFILWENRIRDALEGKPHQSGHNLPLPASHRGPLISMMSRRKTWLKHRQLRSTWTAQMSWDRF